MSKKAEEYIIERRTKGKETGDLLEEAFEEEDREFARETKRKRLEAIVLERELKKRKLQSELEQKPAKKETTQAAPMTTGTLVTKLIQGGTDSKVINEWLKSLDPQALAALIDLQSNSPALATLSFE